LREFQISAARRRFADEEDDEVTSRITRAAEPTMKVTKRYEMEERDDSLRRMIGQAAVRTGIAILAVPDPLPFVDEVAGITLVAGGTYLIATSE
jgi:hypothetical protein